MNTQKLAEAVVHWVSFEVLCGRESLLSEASLRLPIGQFLKGSQKHDVIPEVPLPGEEGKRPKCFDYCLKRKAGNTIVHAIEAKWVGKKARPTFVDEVFDDLYRLGSLRWQNQAEACERWLVIAGIQKWIHEGIWTKELNNAGGFRVPAFADWIDSDFGGKKHNRIYDVAGVPKLPWAGKWRSSAEDLRHDSLLSSLTSSLLGKFPSAPSDDDVAVYVWRVSAPPGAGTRKITDLFPAKMNYSDISTGT
jgi:hypothetical protein